MKLKNLSLAYSAKIFKALSEEPRVRILNLLQNHSEMCISDIEQILDYTQTKTSRHMSYLKNAGIVGARKSDQWIFYYIQDEVQGLLGQIWNYVEKDHILGKDIEVFEVMYSNRELAAFKHKKSNRQFNP
ncbi:MAG: helix-turn-helix transcriptional regulator [Cyclobacteriaceae bacterium]|nr:helix-turn-helix transcriptional regulator [Cyclobacteriaceae bacterium]MCK5281050.1 helix-turn-helix transcriptional regulator [Cyclobacteriaceae bacterium]MCK5368643.1 helix-turn-helix transcriptional regulator [Cyclobacteriaceae bacterium]MCK5467118.1 helix-turn-helix transcriptional regulator [Cyclobacteriaceae bacterium]MCK5703748.1 helix-turn-helix transcriptional regulator [Cyclobacteriaceae bacterium]